MAQQLLNRDDVLELQLRLLRLLLLGCRRRPPCHLLHHLCTAAPSIIADSSTRQGEARRSSFHAKCGTFCIKHSEPYSELHCSFLLTGRVRHSAHAGLHKYRAAPVDHLWCDNEPDASDMGVGCRASAAQLGLQRHCRTSRATRRALSRQAGCVVAPGSSGSTSALRLPRPFTADSRCQLPAATHFSQSTAVNVAR